MKEKVLNFIGKCEGWKTCIKNAHFSSKNMSMHKLYDDIADSIADIEDTVGEIFQGVEETQFSEHDIKGISYEFHGNKELLNDILSDSKNFYEETKKDEKYIGISSEMEGFLGDVAKFQYLMILCLKEQKTQNGKIIKEGKHTYLKLNENELTSYIAECVKKVLNEYW